jgi:hypothetical protein
VAAYALSRIPDEFESLECWKRVWITQEIVVGRTIDFYWGSTTLTKADIRTIYKQFDEIPARSVFIQAEWSLELSSSDGVTATRSANS